ncbi:hypothetical protein AVEN_59492-1 [Araneus ventricosus]|uniref:Uncharacterized protein n=1 Tax=Araneus ventricosus TaxID=182803 RepID=A0A4Y2QVX6_ARAVE|nr:hypothetical protein AVEN_59492-1 [Araneus ventricosus]
MGTLRKSTERASCDSHRRADFEKRYIEITGLGLADLTVPTPFKRRRDPWVPQDWDNHTHLKKEICLPVLPCRVTPSNWCGNCNGCSNKDMGQCTVLSCLCGRNCVLVFVSVTQQRKELEE